MAPLFQTDRQVRTAQRLRAPVRDAVVFATVRAFALDHAAVPQVLLGPVHSPTEMCDLGASRRGRPRPRPAGRRTGGDRFVRFDAPGIDGRAYRAGIRQRGYGVPQRGVY